MSLSGWDADQKIQLSIPAQAAELTDFPVLVNLASDSGVSDFDASAVFTELSAANRKKIAVEVGDTGVQCNVEIEQWDTDNAQLWVKMPTVSDIDDAILNFYYDVTQADNTTYIGDTGDTPAQAVWDSNFVAVYHMAQDPSGGTDCILDSTDNANHGTPQGSMASDDLIDAPIGKALDFNGSNQYIIVPDDNSLDITASITLETSVIQYDTGNHGYLMKGALSGSQGVYSLCHNTGDVTYRLNGSISENNGQVTAGSQLADVWYNMVGAYDGTTQSIYRDGSLFKSDLESLTISTDTNPLHLGIYYNTGYSVYGAIREVRVSNVERSADWLYTTELSAADTLITFSIAGSGSASVLSALGQLYDLSRDPVITALAQDYNLTVAVKNALSQVWGMILEQSLTQHYGDADQILASLTQYYHDAPQVVQALVQKYDDMVQVSTALSQQYNMMFKAETALEQEWAICGAQALAGLVQEYDIRQRNEVIASLGQYWGLFRDSQDVLAPLFWVMADGVLLDTPDFTWTLSAGSAAIECAVSVPDYGQWRSIQLRGSLEIHWNGTTYEFFIEEKPKGKSISGDKEFRADYILKGLSVTAGLEAPYAMPVSLEWPATTQASAIVTELADGVAVDWQIDDFPVYGNTFFVENETPLTAIKRLVGETVRALVQSSSDGKIIIRKGLPVTPKLWNETAAAHVINDDGGLFSDSDTLDVMPGYNHVEISNEAESDQSKRLVEETLSATSKRVRGYSVPWEDDFPLVATGGDWVDVVENGNKEEEIEEELVEFVDGAGSVSSPVYDHDLQGAPYTMVVEWLHEDLGLVTADEDGSLTSAVAGNSLAKITYLSRWREWIVFDQQIEAVQVYVPDVVEV